MNHLFKKLLCALVLAAPAMHAMDSEKPLEQFKPYEDARFAAADKWSDLTAFAAGGAAGGGVGLLGGAMSGDGKAALICAAIGVVVGGGIEVWSNGRYTKAYDAANGKTIHGAAAANNAHGVQAWINYGNSAIAQDNDKMTPLMYAAANGSYEAAQVVGNNMPAEYEIIDSVVETETEKTERGLDRYDWDNFLFPETTKSKSVKKKKVETADMKDIRGKTAFHWAYDGNHFRVMLYLLDAGKANGNVEDKRGRSIKNMNIGKQSINDKLDEVRKAGLARVR